MDDGLSDDIVQSALTKLDAKRMTDRAVAVRQNLLMASDTNPDQYAEAVKLGRKTNTPADFVEADIHQYRMDDSFDSQKIFGVVNKVPTLAEWLENPENAKLAHDDIDGLTNVLDIGRSLPAGAGQGVGQGVQGIGSISKDTSNLMNEMSQKNKKLNLIKGFSDIRMMTAIAGMTLEPIGKAIKDFSADTIAPPKERQNTATNISSGIGQVAAQILVYATTGGIGNAAMTFGQGAQQQQDRLDEAGVTDPAARVAAQTLGGAVTAGTERIQLGVLLKGIPALDSVIGKMSPALQNKWLAKPIDVLSAGGAEAAQETIEGFLQDVINYGYNQDVEFLDGLKQQAGEAGAVGAISRALILGITSGKGSGRGEQANEETAVLKDQLMAAKQAVQETKLHTRDPEKMLEVLAAANVDNKRVTIDGTVLQQFFQSGLDPEEFYNLAPSAREQFEQSDIAGTDISIPYHEFLHAIASAPVPNSYDFMTDFVKSDPNIDMPTDGWDLEDVDQRNAFIQQATEQARQEWEGKFETLQENSLDQLVERKRRDNLMNRELMGEKAMSPEVAATNAAVYGATAKTLLERGGQATRRVLERRFGDALSIEGFRPPLPRKIGTGSVYYDRLRSKVKARKAAEKQGEKKRSLASNLFGEKKQKKEKATPTPLINALVKLGGIKRGSKIAKELESMGIDGKSYPRLYTAKGGLTELDNIPLPDFEQLTGFNGIFSNAEEFNGYIDRQELLDRLRDESFGNYIRTDEQLAAEQQDEYEDQILDVLDRQGVDIETATAEEIDAALKKAREEYAAGFESGDGQQYFQGQLKTDTPEFKKWFGDSKVVDADGKPMVVYHGTDSEFDVFDLNKLGKNGMALGADFYFTNSKELADAYGKPIEVYLSAQNPTLSIEKKTITKAQVKKIVQTLEKIEPDFLSNYGDVSYDGYNKVFNSAIEDIYDMSKNDADVITSIINVGSVSRDIVMQEIIDKTGKDGFVVNASIASMGAAKEDNVYTVLLPTQIKSVNNRGTFDGNDARILYQDNFGVTQFMKDGNTIIKLFEKANMSTFMHETGHLFLDIFAEIAAQPDAPQAIKDDFAKALEWMGVKSYADVKTVHHEKFARGFEAYLYQGEAPSMALKNVFDRFAMWLKDLYKSIKSLNVNVTPEMKGVFDRMLATDEEIEALKSNQLFDVDQATIEMLNPKQQADYLKRKAEAMQTAKDKLFRKAIRQKRRENTQGWKEEFESTQTEVEADLQSQPVYQAIQFLQSGMGFDGKSLMVDDEGNEVAPQPNAHKLNQKMIVDEFDKTSPQMPLGKEELKYLPRGIMTKEGGLDPKIVADMFGFNSGVHMMNAMKSAEPYKLAAQKMTEERMIAKHGDILNDGTIEKEALAMFMAEDTKAAQVELKALSEKTGALYPSDGDFAKAAAIAMGSLKVDTAIKPERYYRAALKASKEYGAALAKKDYEAAALSKRREILNKHLYKQSIKAKEELDSALSKFKELDKKPPKGNAKKVKIDPEYHQKIWDLLDKYNFNPKMSQKKELKIQLAALNQWIQAKQASPDEDVALMMPPELMAADGKTHYRDMTVNEFNAMRDLILNLETQGRNKRKYITQNGQKELEDLVTELVTTAEQNNDPQPVDVMGRSATTLAINMAKQGNYKGAAAKFLFDNAVVNGLDAINTKTAQVMAMLDGGDNFGIWTQTVYEPMQAAEIQKNIRLRTEFTNFKEIMDKHFKDMPMGWMQEEIGADGVTNEAMLSMALHQGTEDNRAKLIDGYAKARGWDAEFIDRVLARMTKRDWEFVQDMWKYLDSFWPETSAVEKRRYGYAPEKIEAIPFEVTTADGQTMQLTGGYMRIMYDGAQDAMAANDEMAQSFKDLTIGRNSQAATKRGSMIERQAGVKRPIKLTLDVLTQHISEQVGIITMAETVENVNKVLRNAKVQETVQSIVGRSGKEMLDLWIKDVAVGNQLSAGKLGWLKSIRSNYTIGRLGLKPVTALLQVSGFSHTIADLGARHAFHGLMKTFSRGNPWLISKEIGEKSVFMRERKFTLNRDVTDALAEYTSKTGSLKNKASALMLYPMQKMQEIVDNTTWMAAYDKAINERHADSEAIRIADMAVARLQASGLTSDLAAIERGTVGTQVQRQELVKATTMFFSYFNAKYNLLKNKNIQFQNGQISATDLAMSYLMALLVEGIISSAIMGQIDWDDDDDDELSAGEIAMGIGLQTINSATATIPFVRTAAGGWQGFSGETAAMGQIAGLGEFTGRMVGTAKMIAEGDSDKINGYQLTRKTVDALNTFIPLPASTINQVVRGMEKEDKTGDANILDYLVYQKK